MPVCKTDTLVSGPCVRQRVTREWFWCPQPGGSAGAPRCDGHWARGRPRVATFAADYD
jgi:hypothetical protein